MTTPGRDPHICGAEDRYLEPMARNVSTRHLVGVAIGTLAPVTIRAVFVLFPAACRRVGMRTVDVARRAVFPALWPVIAPLVILWLGHPFVTTLPSIAALLMVAGLAYELPFFEVALGGAERRFYRSKLTELIGRRWRVAAAA